MDLFQDLEARGLVKQVTDPRFQTLLSKKSCTVYVGFDPTSDSLHVGNLLPILLLKRFQDAGHRPIALTGGATAMIGDPSGKSEERNLLDEATLASNVLGVTQVLKRFLKTDGPSGALFLNNKDWIAPFHFLEFLRDVGKHFTVNHMIAKDSIRSRLEDRENGISYTEFSYMLIQAYDFYHLNKAYQCAAQLGGSDQWGNITAGCELIRRMHAHAKTQPPIEPFGLTAPLILKSDGSKYGKTEKGAVWLDSTRTSPYDFYQFFIQTPDTEVMQLLKFYTFLPLAEIQKIEAEFKKAPEARTAQKILAQEVTRLVHGETELQKAESASSAFFQADPTAMSLEALKQAHQSSPASHLPLALLGSTYSLIDLLVATQVCNSKGSARREIEGGGIAINGKKISSTDHAITRSDLLHGSCILIRRGKKTYHLAWFQ